MKKNITTLKSINQDAAQYGMNKYTCISSESAVSLGLDYKLLGHTRVVAKVKILYSIIYRQIDIPNIRMVPTNL